MIYAKWFLYGYLLLGIIAFAGCAFYVWASRDRDEGCAKLWYGCRSISTFHMKVVTCVAIFFYIVLFWLPLILGIRVPSMPYINRGK